VIWLRAKVTYLLPREILVRRFVTVIGHPLALPIIDAHTIIRAFMVEAGGYLDCRFAVIKRGRPVEVIPDLLYELKGSAVYVRLGGEGTSSGPLSEVHGDEMIPLYVADGDELIA
jgi:hypothetical protein